MRRYARLWLSFIRASWMADIEYRLNVTLKVIGEFMWYTVQLSVFEVLYLHTSTISGWDVHAMRVFMGTLFLVDNLYMLFFHDNMDGLNTLVRRGDLDLYLAKPVNSQFMVSCKKFSSPFIVNLLLLLVYQTWAVNQLPREVSWWQLGLYVLAVPCGTAVYYSLRFMFGTLVIWLQDAGNVQFIWHQLFRLATRPDVVYPFALRLVILTIFPVAFMASVPTRLLVDGPEPWILVTLPTFAGGMLFLSHLFWTRALRQYASASS